MSRRDPNKPCKAIAIFNLPEPWIKALAPAVGLTGLALAYALAHLLVPSLYSDCAADRPAPSTRSSAEVVCPWTPAHRALIPPAWVAPTEAARARTFGNRCT